MPPGELPTIKALTYSSSKWAWVAHQAAPAWGPGGRDRPDRGWRHGGGPTAGQRSGTHRTHIREATTTPGWEAAMLVPVT